MSKKMPTEIIVPAGTSMPDEFYNGIYEYLQDYGHSNDMYASSYGIEIKITEITWEKL